MVFGRVNQKEDYRPGKSVKILKLNPECRKPELPNIFEVRALDTTFSQANIEADNELGGKTKLWNAHTGSPNTWLSRNFQGC